LRASVLPTDKVVEEAAFDKYSYIRNAYLQHRLSEIFDGDPPRIPVNY
jgi:phospholipid-binding lipoprotein MlaA